MDTKNEKVQFPPIHDRKIGIICAGDSEVAPFLPLIDECVIREKAMLKFYSGTLEGVPVVTLFSGVCKTNAAIATQILIDTFNCFAIINAGTSGGMDESIRLFDTVISSESAYWDVSEDVLTDFHPWMDTIYFKANKVLLDLAERAASKCVSARRVFFGRMITGETFIEDRYRDYIKEKYSPLCVDMETAGIAHVCYVNNIPYISIRTITDTAENSGETTFELNCDKASLISADFVVSMLKELFDDQKKTLSRKNSHRHK